MIRLVCTKTRSASVDLPQRIGWISIVAKEHAAKKRLMSIYVDVGEMQGGVKMRSQALCGVLGREWLFVAFVW